MLLKCPRCGNQWDYRGRSAHYASCSSCKTSVKITGFESKPEIQPQPNYQPNPQPIYPQVQPQPYAPQVDVAEATKSLINQEDELEKYKKELDKMVFCPKCFTDIEKGSVFCRNCGYRYYCPYCEEGLIGYEDKPYCMHCGESLDDDDDDPDDFEERLVTKIKQYQCPHCTYWLGPEFNKEVCPNCNFNVYKSPIDNIF